MTEIPCGQARDRMVAEVLGWEWDAEAGWCWDGFYPRCPSTDPADALAALEAWRLADPENRYWQIVASSAGEPRDVKAFHVCIFDQLAVWDADADTLPSAATAALVASKGRA